MGRWCAGERGADRAVGVADKLRNDMFWCWRSLALSPSKPIRHSVVWHPRLVNLMGRVLSSGPDTVRPLR